MLFRHRFLFATSLSTALALTGCADDTTGNETGEGFVDQEAPNFEGVTVVTPEGSDALVIQWDPATDNISSANEISYRVYLATESGAHDFDNADAQTQVDETTTTISGLVDGQAYYVVVRAVDEFGNEDTNSRERVGTVGNLTAPDFGGINTATATGPDSVMLTWSAATDAESPSAELTYNIYTAADNDGQDYLGDPIATAPAGTTEFELTGLNDWTSYWIAVRAVDPGGREDDNTKDIEVLTEDGTPPEFDGVVDVMTSGDGAYLEWTAGRDNATNGADLIYRVFASTTSGGQDFTNPLPDGTSQPGAFGVTVDGLDLDQEYFFVVRAEDEAGLIDANTVEFSATTGSVADQTPPDFFGAVLATTTGANSIQLQWDPASDNDTAETALVYDIYAAGEAGGQDFGAAPVMTTAPGVTTAEVMPLTPEADFYFVVRARDLSGNTDANTREVAATTLVDEIAPTFAGGAQMVATGPQTLEVSWEAAVDDGDKAGEIAYQLFVSTTAGAHDYASPTWQTAPGRTMFEIDSLEPNTEHFVVVRAIDTRDNQDLNEVELSESTWPDTIAPTFVSAPAVSQQGLTEIFVDWEDAVDDVDDANQVYYEVFVSTTPGVYDFLSPAATTPTGLTEATLTGLIPGSTYYVVVRAIDRAGNTGDSLEGSDATVADTVNPTFDGAFQILGASANTVTVAWPEATDNYSPHANITYHLCWVDSTLSGPTGCSGGNFVSMDTAVGQTQANITGLTVSRTYFIVVRAEDEFSNIEGNSRVVVATTTPDVTAPVWDPASNMSDIAAVTLNEGQVDLTWNTVTDDVTTDLANIAYDIYVAENVDAMSFAVPHTTVVGVQATTVSGLTPNTPHRFVVRARDLAGNRSSNTDEASATTSVDNTAPVGGVLATASATGCRSLFMTWSAATDLGTAAADIDYLVCVGTFAQCGGSSFSNVVKTVTGTTSTSHTVSEAGSYYVKIRARDSSNNTNANNTNQLVNTTSLDTGNPTTPSNFSLSTSANTPTTITVDWNESTDSCWSQNSLYYEICRSTSSAGCTSSNFPVHETTADGDGIENITASQDTTYWVGLRAVDDSGNRSAVVRGSVKSKVAWGGSGLEARMVSTCDGASCHGDGWQFGEMVGVSGTGCSNTTQYIDTFNHSNSRIYNKIASSTPTCTGGTTGSRMPADGVYWSSTQITDLRDWINQGAVNND